MIIITIIANNPIPERIIETEPITVFITSLTYPPTTGTDEPIINLPVRIATESAAEVIIDWTDVIAVKIVVTKPSVHIISFFIPPSKLSKIPSLTDDTMLIVNKQVEMGVKTDFDIKTVSSVKKYIVEV